MSNTAEVMPEVSLFDIPLDMIKSPDGANGEIDLDGIDNRDNPHNADIYHKVRNIQWDLDMLKEDLESSNQMLKDGSYTDWGMTEDSIGEYIAQIEADIQAKEQEIAILNQGLQIKEKGTVKQLIKNVIPAYAQTLQSRGYDPENAMLASPVSVSPVWGVPGRYMMHMQIKGLMSSSPERRNASMLTLETSVNDIDSKYPMRNEHFVLANIKGRTMLLGTYQQLLEKADAQKLSVKDYIKQQFQADQSNLMEMWIGDAERAVD